MNNMIYACKLKTALKGFVNSKDNNVLDHARINIDKAIYLLVYRIGQDDQLRTVDQMLASRVPVTQQKQNRY